MSDVSSIAITGLGLATSLGLSAPETWERCARGETGITPIRRFDVAGRSCGVGAAAPAFDASERMRVPKHIKFANAGLRLAVYAASEAVTVSGLDFAQVPGERISVVTASGDSGLEAFEFFPAFEMAEREGDPRLFTKLGGRASRLIDRLFPIRTLPNGGVGLLSGEYQARGPGSNFVDGPTDGAMALYEACLNLEDSLCDVALVAAYDSLLNVSSYLSYENRGWLAAGGGSAALRPFDRRRDGTVLGEAASVLVLERPADARRRGARILGEITGFGAATDCADAPEPGDPARILAAAVDAAGGSDAGFVSAHGIGTVAGDRWEAGALAGVVGSQVPVTSLKGYTGYVGAATATVEIGIGLMAIRSGVVPMVGGLREPDPDFDLNLVCCAPRNLGAGGRMGLFVSWSWAGQCTVVRVRAEA